MFSLTGIPPTAGFVGKFMIFSAAVQSGFTWLAALMVVASVISAYYYLKVVVSMYMWTSDRAPIQVRVGTMATIALLVTLVGVLALGVFPGGWLDLARGSVDGLLRGPSAAVLP